MKPPLAVPGFWLSLVGPWRVDNFRTLMDEVRKRGIDPRDTDAVQLVWLEIKPKPEQ